MEDIVILVTACLVVYLLLWGGVQIFIKRQQRRFASRQTFVFLKIVCNRDNENGPVAFEQLLSSLHGVLEKVTWRDKLAGRIAPRFSFEIANIEGRIGFYAWIPKYLQRLVENQLYAQYPKLDIFETTDYTTDPAFNASPAQYKFTGLELELDTAYIFPIKKYAQFEDKVLKKRIDPLSGITAAMDTLNNYREQLWIQYVMRPLDDSWHRQGMSYYKKLQGALYKKLGKKSLPWIEFNMRWQSSSLFKLLRVIFFPITLTVWLIELIVRGRDQQITSLNLLKDIDQLQKGEDISDRSLEDSITSKLAKLGYEVSIRAVYAHSPEWHEASTHKLMEVASSFKQFNLPHLNGFKVRRIIKNKQLVLGNFQQRSLKDSFRLNTEEVATIFHLPSIDVTTPSIEFVNYKKLDPPSNLPLLERFGDDVTVLGATNFRGQREIYGIKTIDRRRHVYIMGKTGMGKSVLLQNMIHSDIYHHKGVAVIDPHGDLAESVINFTPAHRINDVIVLDPSDIEFPIGINLIEKVTAEQRPLIASGFVGVFKKMFGESWGPRLEYIMRNAVLALLEYPNSTIIALMQILIDPVFRAAVVNKVSDPIVRSFWETEFARLPEKEIAMIVSPIQNKVGQFLSSTVVRNILAQPKSSVSLRWAMDKGKIVVINLSKGKIGEDSSSLLGSMMISKFQIDAMSRADTPEEQRRDFFLYVDEFQNFATDSFATILSEARKYRLNLTMANQFMSQMPEVVRDAVFGNVGSIITFQTGATDAEFYSQQFGEEALPADLCALSKYTTYSRIMIDGMPSKTFSSVTLPPPPQAGENREKIIRLSREKYAKKRDFVEGKIKQWADQQRQNAEEEQRRKKERPDKKPFGPRPSGASNTPPPPSGPKPPSR